MMKFVEPLILLLIPAIILFGFALAYSMEKRKKALLAVIGTASTLSSRKRWMKYTLLISGAVMLVIAAARPYMRMENVTAEDDSRDVLVLFDVSKSMRANDLPPSRMEQAKYLLREVFKAFPGDRFGIVPFAGKAFLSCPLTADHQALAVAVDDLDTSSVPVGGTNLSAALETAKKAFAGSEGDHRAVILLTDGDQLDGDALKSASALGKENIPVIAVGFGSPDLAAPVPGDNGGVMHSRSGEVAGSRLDEALLQKIAAETKGIYLRSTVNDIGFSGVEKFLDKLNKAAQQQISAGNPDDLFGIFLAAGAILLFLSGLLSECRKCTAAVIVFFSCFILAAQETENVSADPLKLYQEALELQQSGNKGAEELYEKIISAKDTPALLRGRALHNLAVMRHINARETVIKSRNALQNQNSDAALKEVDAAIKELDAGKELYTSSMGFRENETPDLNRVNNYQQLILDKIEAEKLKKQLEELKKQQQQAQNQAQNAQQQNQQNQQQQNQQQQNQQQQNQQQQNQQNQQQQNQQSASSAAEAAKQLEKQARDLGQNKLAENAESAAQALKDAAELQKEGKKDEAQKKLDEAVKKLGSPEQKDKNGEKSDKKDKKGDDGKGDEPEQKKNDTSAENAEEGAEKDEKKESAERKLELLDDEAEKLRDAMRRQRNMRRAPVEKDW